MQRLKDKKLLFGKNVCKCFSKLLFSEDVRINHIINIWIKSLNLFLKYFSRDRLLVQSLIETSS